MSRCLGKLDPKIDPRTFTLKSILNHAALPTPKPFDWDSILPVDVGMMANDRIGLCAVAAVAHLIQAWSANHLGNEITIADDDVIAAYKAITLQVNGRAFDESDPTTDTGLCLLDVLKWVRLNGLGPDRHGLGLAFVKLSHEDPDEIEIAGNACGGLYVGAQLPIAAEEQLDAGEAWSPVQGADGQPGGWGGHAMAMTASDGVTDRFLTWGKRQSADDPWIGAYLDEAYACIAPEWVSGALPAPSGLDMDRLRALLAAL